MAACLSIFPNFSAEKFLKSSQKIGLQHKSMIIRRSIRSPNLKSSKQVWSATWKNLIRKWLQAYSARVSTQAQRILKSFRKTLQAHTHGLCASISLQSNAGHWSHDRIF